MGRIKTRLIKRKGNEILNKHMNKFTNNFEKNKNALIEVAEIKSKKLRNSIAGHITRLVKRQQ